MRYHHSFYNRTVKIPGGQIYAVHNFRTGVTIRLNPFSKALFDRADEYPEKKAVKKLIEYGFLVNYDEFESMKAASLSAVGSSDLLSFTICPTMECNFRCPYCFEEKRPGVMPEETQEKLLAFVKENIESLRPKFLYVTWFGGEPTLCMKVIERLSEGFIRICRENDVKYSAGIITNGYLFNRKNADILEKCCVNTAQITLDGPDAETHDKTRFLANGDGSFAEILENLKGIRTGIRISIRCNINAENAAKYAELDALIKSIAEETGNDISLYFHRMFCCPDNYVDDLDATEKIVISDEDYEAVRAADRGDTDLSMRFRALSCQAQHRFSFVIDEMGRLYKCLEVAGNEEYAICSISDGPDCLFLKPENSYRFINTVIPEEKECRECILFPSCRGGCPMRYIDILKPAVMSATKTETVLMSLL